MARATSWLLGSTVLAALALRPWCGDALALTRYTGYVMPWLLVGLVPAAIWAWTTHARALSVMLAIPAAVIAAVHAPLLRPRGASASPSAVTLRVMSYNTWSENTDASRIASVVLEHRPDLLLLQEIPAEVLGALVLRLRDLHPGEALYEAYEPCTMQAVVSRYPVEPRRSLDDEGQAQEVLVRSPAGAVTVFNVHPLRVGGWRQRYRQIAALLDDHVLRERGPVILGGDLNAPDHSELYALVARRLRNAQREAGSGFAFTYPSPEVRWGGVLPLPPVVRIDHIFFSDHFAAVRASTIERSGGSDHRPVLADLAVRARPPDDVAARPAQPPR